ncbi:hypothetical protein H4R33_004586 [Dimargaris cristalligena]|uniref:Single-stranded DNA binding protein Ssb-like OB fold domain-containing protein n=1 Tax=Dimargaris cristalligena TaxID=215637 RepID=A0A4P9ZXB2_9FUNG|nr:hypothetical protein H4R33_004586 [Dimargaris cristalligena]RKP37532.1 hypothetical protein BJ085DRAFT_30378 [Dimargaris cristalligena]|eukprot:RKP37532.1 hypothetical protein BJ085DRAFT_30378 [Dimargaris cristalligena]
MSGFSGGGPRTIPVGDLRPMLRGFECEVIIIEVPHEPVITRDKMKIYTFLVADTTGSILMSLWGEMGEHFRVGDIVHITGGEARLFKGSLQLTVLKYGSVKRVGEHTKQYVERPNMSTFQWTSDPDQPGPLRPVLPPAA